MLNYLKGNTSRFGSATQVSPSDIGQYLSSFFNAVVVVAFYFYFYFVIEKCFFFNLQILLSERKFTCLIACLLACLLTYSIVIDEMESEFLKSQELQHFLWLRFVNDIFFIWTYGEEKLTQFLNELNDFYSNLKFTYETSSRTANILDQRLSTRNGAIQQYIQTFSLNQRVVINISTISLLSHCTLRPQ